MTATLAINDLTISSEMDRKALADITGGGRRYSSGWELVDKDRDYLGKKYKCGKWYKKYRICKKYRKVIYKHCHKIVWKPIYC